MIMTLLLMQDGVVPGNTWDLREESPLAMHAKVYAIFLFVVCIIAVVKLARTWWGALPFLYLRRALRPTYLAELRVRKTSLGQWINLVLIVWGVVTAMEVVRICGGIETTHSTGAVAISGQIGMLAGMMEVTLCVVLALYLVRWNVIRRMERLEAQ